MKIARKITLVGVLALGSVQIMAQKAPASKPADQGSELDRWSLGLSGGVTIFYGEIKQHNFLPVYTYNNELLYAGGIFAERSFSPVFSMRIDGLDAKLAGTSVIHRSGNTYSNPYNQSVSFLGDVWSGDLSLVINFSNLSLAARSTPRRFAFYGMAGIGYMFFDSEVKTQDGTTVLSKVGISPETKKQSFDLQFGLGVKLRLSDHFDLGLNEILHNPATDLLDATEVAGSTFDKFTYTNLSLTYKFGAAGDKNQWINPMDALTADINSVKAKVEGLSNDQDKDGVADIFDKDNATPAGTKVYGDGTAVDTDGDGIPDSQDVDPFTAKGAKVDDKGREMDADGDGVPDSKDLEPNTVPGMLVNFQGKTINIETSNKSDINNTGYLPSIYFTLGSAGIQAKYQEEVAAVARVLKTNTNVRLVIQGHADSKGSEKLNEKLALKRAQAVIESLKKIYAIDPERLQAESKGSAEPFALGKDAINRRVDFLIIK